MILIEKKVRALPPDMRLTDFILTGSYFFSFVSLAIGGESYLPTTIINHNTTTIVIVILCHEMEERMGRRFSHWPHFGKDLLVQYLKLKKIIYTNKNCTNCNKYK